MREAWGKIVTAAGVALLLVTLPAQVNDGIAGWARWLGWFNGERARWAILALGVVLVVVGARLFVGSRLSRPAPAPTRPPTPDPVRWTPSHQQLADGQLELRLDSSDGRTRPGAFQVLLHHPKFPRFAFRLDTGDEVAVPYEPGAQVVRFPEHFQAARGQTIEPGHYDVRWQQAAYRPDGTEFAVEIAREEFDLP
jgi:hypothetical protein